MSSQGMQLCQIGPGLGASPIGVTYNNLMISTTGNTALSPGQPPSQPLLSGGQEGAKNLPALYPGNTTMTNQTSLTANELTISNAVENPARENLPASQNYETLEPYNTPGEWTTVVGRQKNNREREMKERIRQD